MRTTKALTALYRESGRKMTVQRQFIFDALQGKVSHPSAEMIFEEVRTKMPTISLKTVYQTLNELAEMGEVAALDLGTGMARFDPNVDHDHHHLVCRSCGAIRDLFVDFDGLAIDSSEAQGFQVSEAEVVFRGLCASCASAESLEMA